MAAAGQTSPSLLRKLSTAAQAASDFSHACKRGLSTMVDNNSSQSFSVLSEDDLTTWRQASEPLTKDFSTSAVYFAPRSMFLAEDASHIAQVDAVNLALVLEMFLPLEIRTQYPKLTTKIPLVDDLPSQTDRQELEEQIERFTRPLNALKSIYLHLCAGRKEKHINYIIRGILLDLCTTSAVVVKNARRETGFKLEDLVSTFDSAFLRDSSLVPSVFATQAIQNKAVKTWSSEGATRLHKLQEKPESGDKYTWESLCEVFLRDALKNLVPGVLDRVDVERARNASSKKANAKSSKTTRLDKQTRATSPSTVPTSHVAEAQALTSDPVPSSSKQPAKITIPASDTHQTRPIVDSHISAPARSGNPAQGLGPEPFPLFADDGGSNVMEYVQDSGGSEDGEGEDVPVASEPRPRSPSPLRERKIPKDFRFNVRQPNAVKIHMTPSPSPVRSPSPPAEVRAASMIRKIKKTVTADNDRNRTISTSTVKSKDSFNAPSKTKSRARPDPFIDILKNMDEDEEIILTKKKKRKVNPEEADEAPRDGDDVRKAKKRKVGDMPPPALTSGPAASTSTSAAAEPYAAHHSSARLTNSNELAGPSSAAPVRMNPAPSSTSRAAAPKPRRNHVLAAETSSESEQDLGSRARQTAQKRARLYNRGKKTNPIVIDADPEDFPPARPATFAPGPISLVADSRRCMDMKSRLAEIRVIHEREKKKDTELAEDEAKQDKAFKKAKVETDSDPTEDSGSDYQDAKSHASSGESDEEVDPEEAVKRSKAWLAETKKKVARHKSPVQRRQNHLPVESDDEDEPQPESKPKKGRPRKIIRDSSEEPPAPATEKKYRYATGGNTAGGRVKWTEEEDKTLMFAIEAIYYGGNLLKPWAQVLDRHGPQGKDDQKLAGRNCVQVKDRARNIARKYAAQGQQIPVYLQWIKLSEKPAEGKQR